MDPGRCRWAARAARAGLETATSLAEEPDCWELIAAVGNSAAGADRSPDSGEVRGKWEPTEILVPQNNDFSRRGPKSQKRRNTVTFIEISMVTLKLRLKHELVLVILLTVDLGSTS